MSEPEPVVGITMGDPAGIGCEIIVRAYDELRDRARIVVVGDASVFETVVDRLDADVGVQAIDDVDDAAFDRGSIPVLDVDNVVDHEFGVVRERFGRASLEYVERAIALAKAGRIDAITTCPIHKQATRLAGSEFNGHTGLLAARTDTDNYAMMLVEETLRVTHVSTHVPLEAACEMVTEAAVLDTIRVTDRALRRLGVDDPTVAVAGLNPHASDGGLMGDTERTEIAPAVDRARDEGIDAFGPESPDTVFVAAANGDADCVVAMYHDQGHIPIKMLGFGGDGAVSGVNVTIGLPIIRTSVDHGTAFDIAGDGVASPRSLVDAVDVAVRAVRNS